MYLNYNKWNIIQTKCFNNIKIIGPKYINILENICLFVITSFPSTNDDYGNSVHKLQANGTERNFKSNTKEPSVSFQIKINSNKGWNFFENAIPNIQICISFLNLSAQRIFTKSYAINLHLNMCEEKTDKVSTHVYKVYLRRIFIKTFSRWSKGFKKKLLKHMYSTVCVCWSIALLWYHYWFLKLYIYIYIYNTQYIR